MRGSEGEGVEKLHLLFLLVVAWCISRANAWRTRGNLHILGDDVAGFVG